MMTETTPVRQLYPRQKEFLERLTNRHEPYMDGLTIRVPTDVILPTHEIAVVSIDGGAHDERYTLGDGGQIFRSLDIQNYHISLTVRRAVERVARSRGMQVIGNELMTNPVSADQVIPYIPHVAEVMREAMISALSKVARNERLMLRHRIGAILNRISGEANVTPDFRMQGSTTDRYKFDFSVMTAKHKRLLLDAPIPDPSSIAATILRQSDVRLLHLQDVKQVIAYDPSDHWPSSNLAQLQLANVPLVNVDQLEGMLQR
ncbi:hypothetical protein [Gluconobacter kondonii]|uniref:hypothetical protein n=1 Tax=Gluconobacter kondonii TaxID=941463 RepID=UPI0019826E08|nr:hypothetical protein [Gluconobacter kondonii]MBN3867480.1 hypothetical protein [Gluconobacter kondonii]